MLISKYLAVSSHLCTDWATKVCSMKVRDGITICTICITACIISTKEIEDGTKLRNVLRFSHLRSQLILYLINESAGESKFILQLFEYHRDIRGL